MVHGEGTRADGRRSRLQVNMSEIVGARVGRAARSIRIMKSNVVHVQPGQMARPTTKAPETQIYFTTRGSAAFPVPRVRTVVRGERASRSIVNRTTALWSIWIVASLILAASGYEAFSHKREDAEMPIRAALTEHLK